MLTGHWCYIHSRSTTKHLLKNAFFRCFECFKLPTNLYTVSGSQSSCECCWASLARLILLCRPDYLCISSLVFPFVKRTPLFSSEFERNFSIRLSLAFRYRGFAQKGREEWKENNKKMNEQISKHAKTQKERNKQTMKLAPSPIFAPFCSRLLHYLRENTWRELNCSRLSDSSDGAWVKVSERHSKIFMSLVLS